jgi:hypothetical protein
MVDDPRKDPLGTIRVVPRWQDNAHSRELAIRWCSPIFGDESYPWIILDTDGSGPQRLSHESLEGCERLSLDAVAQELQH